MSLTLVASQVAPASAKNAHLVLLLQIRKGSKVEAKVEFGGITNSRCSNHVNKGSKGVVREVSKKLDKSHKGETVYLKSYRVEFTCPVHHNKIWINAGDDELTLVTL